MKKCLGRVFFTLLVSICLVACGGGEQNTSSPISSTSPAAHDTEVALSSEVTITFNKSMDSSTIDNQSFTLVSASGKAISGNVSYSGLKATFTPSDDLALSVSYTATITGIMDASGIPLGTPHTWSFTTRDGTWATPVLINTSVDSASSFQIAMDAYGNGITVWAQSNGMLPFIWARSYVRGSGWGDPAMIQDVNAGSGEQPQIAMSESGSAAVVWVENDQGNCHLMSKWFVPQEGWRSSTLVETNATDNVSDPYIAINKLGTAIVVWHQSDGTQHGIWANKGTPNGWGTPVRLDNAQSNALWPRVVMDENGGAVAIWVQRDDMLSSTTSVWASVFKPETGWSNPLSLPDNGLGFDSPRIAGDATGNTLIVGTDWGTTPARVKAVWYLPQKGFGIPFVIATVTQQTIFKDVAMNDRGEAIVVWLQSDGFPPYRVWAKRYSVQNGWQAATMVDGGVGTSGRPRAIVDGNGNAFVLWERSEAPLYGLWVSRCLMDDECGTPTPISTGYGDLRSYADIAVDRQGRALTVWRLSPALGNSPWLIWGSVFE